MDEPHPGTLAWQIAQHAQATPSAPAILAPGRTTLTYAGLSTRIVHTAHALANAGFGRCDRIALALPHGPEMAVASLAIASCATCVPLDPDGDIGTLRAVCERARVAAIVLADDGREELVAMARALARPALLASLDQQAPAGTYTLAMARGAARVPVRFALSDDIAFVLNTSGTTGRAKLVPLRHRNEFDCAVHRARCFAIAATDRSLCVNPFFTASGLRRGLFPLLAVGGSAVCPPDRDPDHLLAWLSAFSPTLLSASPTLYRAILDAIERRDEPARHALRFVMSGSAGMPADLELRIEARLGVPIVQHYAMTEVSGIAHNPLPPGERRPGSAGLVDRGEVAILGEDAQFAAVGMAGEIVVRGPHVFDGYEDDEAANREAFFGDWFRTGDIGYFDADGYLHISGRRKELINRGGFKVSPAEVDAVLLRHSNVADAGTFGVPHPTLGEDVVAAVVFRDAGAAMPEALRDYAFTELAKFKVPTRIVAIDRIPRTVLGKVRRHELARAVGELPRPAYVEPVDERARFVAGLFADVLKWNDVGARDNFFSLGGDSLRAAQVISRANARFDCALAGDTLFRRPTVAQFADAIREALVGGRAVAASPIVPLPRRVHARVDRA
jgi:acyl-CoA synthetase (AMP-forming)/AMP-acid ligase II